MVTWSSPRKQVNESTRCVPRNWTPLYLKEHGASSEASFSTVHCTSDSPPAPIVYVYSAPSAWICVTG